MTPKEIKRAADLAGRLKWQYRIAGLFVVCGLVVLACVDWRAAVGVGLVLWGWALEKATDKERDAFKQGLASRLAAAQKYPEN